jgi:hypothetical protein
MDEAPARKIATDPDWLWRDTNTGRSAGLYGEVLPDRSQEPSPFARSVEAAADQEPTPL